MKNKINKVLVIVAAIAAITIGYIQKSQSSSEVSSLLLENVEALAHDEAGSRYCFGVGTVDCPFNNTKVDSYYAPYSLLY